MVSPNLVSKATNPWISCPHPNAQARLRLFCFPYAGGGAAVYSPWSKLLHPDVELYAVRLPGRENRIREAPYVRLSPLVKDLAGALSPYFDRPFAFFGHSMGALIVFELARSLRDRNKAQPHHLFVSGHRAPQIPDSNPSLYQLPNHEFAQELQQRYNGIPQAILENPELMQFFLPIMRADMTLVDTYMYTPNPPLDCPISVFGGKDDPIVNAEDLDAWRRQTTRAFRLRMFAGEHFFLQSAQTHLLQALNQDLASQLE